MSDVYLQPEQPAAGQIFVYLPDDAAQTVMKNDESGTMHLCDGYSVAVQTVESGDLNSTLKTVTGFSREKLKIMEYLDGEYTRYVCAWATAGEGGDQVGKTAILDDGRYHYTVTVMAPAESASALEETWQQIFDSFSIVP